MQRWVQQLVFNKLLRTFVCFELHIEHLQLRYLGVQKRR
jgi:hypothetical protein